MQRLQRRLRTSFDEDRLLWLKSHATALTDLLDDGERLLKRCNLFPQVPGVSGHVVTDQLEDVWGHVGQVNSWRQEQHQEWTHELSICKTSGCDARLFYVFLWRIMAKVQWMFSRKFPLSYNGNSTFLSVSKAMFLIIYYFVWMTGYQPAVNIFPAPDITTTLQSGLSAISLKRVTISLTGEKKKTKLSFSLKVLLVTFVTIVLDPWASACTVTMRTSELAVDAGISFVAQWKFWGDLLTK